jgi:amino acid permease
MVWLVTSVTSFRFREAVKAQNDPLFSEILLGGALFGRN